ERLIIQAGTRLNGIGADLRRRLTGRGDKAMRLRQVINHGAGVEGGDPLFELRPVWMASPETVAQLFPRQPIFDLVVFDEASQCRLEEALPVLTRAKRVVIAGDPKQLPPTRFFESSIATSDEDDTETDQELFEAHQGELEADKVVAIVKDLLKKPQPPSIGIACFNLPQRDLIVEKLEEAAEADADFAAKLAEARLRRGADFSEGLFIKNLENVQGDERDH